MNGDVNSVAPRPRPLSGGLWTLLSWLRRDERDSSTESLSSAGSDRTAASFAFLTPAHYPVVKQNNVLPELGPPTDSYKKRLHERNVRRQYERDLTLHRKYGLYRSEGGTGYDTFTLQHNRRNDGDSIGKWNRERRATSECLQRRPVHVPGKRRAPLPPVSLDLSARSVTLARRSRKRPAPQPPFGQPKENIHLNNISAVTSSLNCREHSTAMTDTSVDCKSEKYVKKDTNRKDTKTRSEKSFLKQIFENKKKCPKTGTVAIKILPSISELDKQAAEIIESERRKAAEHSSTNFYIEKTNQQNPKIKEFWFCTKCLKKYDTSVEECFYCYPKVNDVRNSTSYFKNEIYTQTDNGIVNPSTSSNNKIEDKQKLKELLKEMKDSLPKRSKHEKDLINKTAENTLKENTAQISTVTETPTLRIGSPTESTENVSLNNLSCTGIEKDKNPLTNKVTEDKTPNIVHEELKQSANSNNSVRSVIGKAKITELLTKVPQFSQDKSFKEVKINKKEDISVLTSTSSKKRDLHTPLRISALLNPVYIPKNKISNKLSKDALPAKDTSNARNKSEDVPITMLTLDGGNPNTKLAKVSITQMKSLDFDTSKLKPDIIESTIRPQLTSINEESNVNNTDAIIQPKSSTPPTSNMPPLKQERLHLKSLESYHKKNKHTECSSANVLLKPASLCNNASILSLSIEKVNQHVRRRELVNQLEKSIAEGDENAAAEAAVKLAQLRLSCSVLSFSSQIITEPSTSLQVPVKTHSNIVEDKDNHIIPLNKLKSENKNSKFKNTTDTTPAKLSMNEVKLVQDVKESPPAATEKLSTKTAINRNVIVQTTADLETDKKNINDKVSIQVWVEDKEAARGPINLNIPRQSVMAELRMQAETVLGLPSRLQRWIVGRTLCTDDNTPIVTLAGPELNAPFYLCLVDPGQSDENKPSTSRQVDEKRNNPDIVQDLRQKTIKAIDKDNVKELVVRDTVRVMMQNENEAANVYKELVKLEQQPLVGNAEAFECGVCMDECLPDHGVVLRECVHAFCRDCLTNLVKHCQDADVMCPAMGCHGILQEREIRALVSPEDYERWLARGLAAAESGTRNAFHCRTRDCTGWALCDPGVQKFPCPVCKHTNCIPCQAIHKGETCDEYRAKSQSVTNTNSDQIDVSTRALIDALINKGEALECPECKAIITKKWGCDWVKCSACKTEICWVTRGRRWGPAGRGDTSSGCRCGVDGKKCHPSCGYCH